MGDGGGATCAFCDKTRQSHHGEKSAMKIHKICRLPLRFASVTRFKNVMMITENIRIDRTISGWSASLDLPKTDAGITIVRAH